MLSRKIRALLFADVVWYFGEGLFGPLLAVFAERIGGDVLDIAGAWATYLIVTGALIILVGRLSDKVVDKRKMILAGYLLNAIFTFAYLLVDSQYRLLAVQAGLGVAAALATPTWDALYAEYGERRRGAFLWGLADGFSQLCVGVAIILGGIIVTYLSFDLLFLIMGSIQLLSVILLLPAVRKGAPGREKH